MDDFSPSDLKVAKSTISGFVVTNFEKLYSLSKMSKRIGMDQIKKPRKIVISLDFIDVYYCLSRLTQARGLKPWLAPKYSWRTRTCWPSAVVSVISSRLSRC